MNFNLKYKGKGIQFLTFVSLIIAFTFLAISIAQSNPSLTMACDGKDDSLKFCLTYTQKWTERTGITVRIVKISPQDKLSYYRQILLRKDTPIDIISMETYNVTLFKNDLLDMSKYILKTDYLDKFFQFYIPSLGNKIISIPWKLDLSILYFRKDLLKKYNKPIPTSWQELLDTTEYIYDAERKLGNKKFYGFIFQGDHYEQLTNFALELIISNHGLTPDFEKLNLTKTTQALSILKKLLKFSPKGVMNFTEEDSRAIFQSGNSLFMRNLTYSYNALEAIGSTVHNKIGIAQLPKSNSINDHNSIISGNNLVVTKNSIYPKEAIDLILYLSSKEVQQQSKYASALKQTITNRNSTLDKLVLQNLNSIITLPVNQLQNSYYRWTKVFSENIYSYLYNNQSIEVTLNEIENLLEELRSYS